MNKVPRIKLFCADCGKPFLMMQCELTRGRGKYCSKACSVAGGRRATLIACTFCAKEFIRTPSQRGKTMVDFCSRACYDASRPPKPNSYKKIGSRHEHRIVAERSLGRPLARGEIVHHCDDNKQHNIDRNLAVITQRRHASIHFKGTKQTLEHIAKRMASKAATIAARKSEANA